MRLGATAAVLLAVVGACGGDDGGGDDACSAETACGGDPVGEWRTVGQCFEITIVSECEELQVDGEREVSGTLSMRSNQSYIADLTRTLHVDVTFPMSCFNGYSCEDFAATLGSCELMGDVCNCVTDRVDDDGEEGQWYVSETSLGLVNDAGNSGLDRVLDMGDFCADEDRLVITADRLGDGPIAYTGHVVFERTE